MKPMVQPALLLLLAGLTGPLLRAGESPPQHQFLFIVDTSSSMAPRKQAAIQIVRDLILGGFEGQIAQGDSIDIWTFDAENHIERFPPEIWEGTQSQKIARRADAFLANLKFRGRGRFEPVAEDLRYLIPLTKGILILLLTDAEESITGLGFDAPINEYLSKHRGRLFGSKRPFLICFSAVEGKLTDWRVFHGESQERLPRLPARMRPELATEEPRPSPKTRAEPPKEPEPPPVVFAFPPGARVAPRPVEKAVPPLAPVEAPKPAATAPEPRPVLAPATNAVPAGTNPPPTIQVESRAMQNPMTNPIIALRAPSATREPLYFAAGIGLLFTLLGAALLFRRKTPEERSSLITKSFRK